MRRQAPAKKPVSNRLQPWCSAEPRRGGSREKHGQQRPTSSHLEPGDMPSRGRDLGVLAWFLYSGSTATEASGQATSSGPARRGSAARAGPCPNEPRIATRSQSAAPRPCL
ncbi:hypothetical protein BS50DRAFT_180532 [Corynespora cassiicola Philippines]|uniref:Uncharacterized protein n=1 Tax=Corynespora cassiicola Philippines TaxID=1448308 RepID=A0A2T2P644_CORCC|nr:hypothetical protein BS50DRAFT_180532 [Corynespora cassiicola Philippines]